MAEKVKIGRIEGRRETGKKENFRKINKEKAVTHVNY